MEIPEKSGIMAHDGSLKTKNIDREILIFDTVLIIKKKSNYVYRSIFIDSDIYSTP